MSMELSGDDIAANGLVIAKYAMSMPNVVVDNGKCCMHQGHLAFMGAAGPMNLCSPLHALGCAFKAYGNQLKLQRAMIRVAKTAKVFYEMPPGGAEAANRKWVLDNTICCFHGIENLQDDVRRDAIRRKLEAWGVKVQSVLNGRWCRNTLEHFCHKVLAAVVAIVCASMPVPALVKAVVAVLVASAPVPALALHTRLALTASRCPAATAPSTQFPNSSRYSWSSSPSCTIRSPGRTGGSR